MIQEEKRNKQSMTSNEEITFLKNQLDRITRLLKDKDDKIEALSLELNESRTNKLEDSLNMSKVIQFEQYKKDDINKEVVKLYAYGYASGFIYKQLNEKLNKNVAMDDIEKIIYGLRHDPYAIDNSLHAYYLECKKIFEENKIAKGLFANTLYTKLDLLEEDYSRIQISAREAGDYKEERMILDSLTKLARDRASIFSKNVLGVFDTGTSKVDGYDEEYKKLKDMYEGGSENRKVLKIKTSNS